jgi:exopolyphosphatase/guanosine-5'-triphosphate,3'-diphosphate pyrophosphatase
MEKLFEKNAVIDVGSNSVRLMLVADGKVLYKAVEITRLGEGIAQSKTLKPQAIERTAKAIADFYIRAKNEGAKSVFAFATAAVRSAENRLDFIHRVEELCSLRVEVVSGETEAELGLLGALGDDDGAILDIGGASTEIIVRNNGELVYKKSVDVGVVRLKDLCARDVSALRAYAISAVKEFGNVPLSCVRAIGGTATSIAAIALRLKEYDADAVSGFVLTKEKLAEAVEYLAVTPVERVVAETCVPEKRAEVLLGGAIWLQVLTDELRMEQLTVSDADNLEGYAVRCGLLQRK